MIKKIVFAGVGLAMLVSPLVASAQTTSVSSDNATLIALLTQLVQTLEHELQQLIATRSESITSPVVSNAPPTSTVVITTGITQGASFTASPTSGTAPFAVTFNSVSGQNLQGDTVNFGDGTSGTMSMSNCNEIVGAGAACSFQASHTYQSAGTYTATLYGPLPQCPAGTSNCSALVLGTLTITVSGSTQSNAPSIVSIAPSSGYSVGGVSLTGQQPTEVTIMGTGFGSSLTNTVLFNGPETGSASAYVSNNGTQLTFPVPSEQVQGCNNNCEIAPVPQALPAGTYQVSDQNANGTSNSVPFTVLSSSQPPTLIVTPTSGSAPLQVTLSASPLYSNAGTYTVNFGDGTSGQLVNQSNLQCASGQVCSYQGSASHIYSSAGNYTATFLDSSGNTVGTATISVSPSVPVLSCTISLTPTSTGYGITWTSQDAVTAHLSPIPGTGSGWVNVALNNSTPSNFTSDGQTTYTLTVLDSSGDQATCST